MAARLRVGPWLWVALVLALLPSTGAPAACPETPFFVFPSGGALPPSPSLYVFSRKGLGRLRLTAEDGSGRQVRLKLHPLASDTTYNVHRLELAPVPPGALRLYRVEGPGRTLLASYTVAKSPPPAAGPVEVLEQRFTNLVGTPYEYTRDLVVSVEAPAYRVTFARSREDWLTGALRSVVVPGRSAHGVRTLGDVLPLVGQGLVPLGLPVCFIGRTFSWEEGPAFLRLTALRTDGTESPLPAEPVLAEPPPW